MPFAKISSVAARISSLVTVLLMTRRRRSDPVSGAMVIDRSPLCAQQPDDRLGEVVEPQRGRADRVAHVDQAGQDALDLRVIAERDRDQSRALREYCLRLRGQLEDAVGRKRPHRQVVVAGPAEAAQVRAAADHLDQEPRAELGVGREDRRRRRIEAIGALHRRLLHDRRRAGARLAARTPRSCRRPRSARRRTTGCRSRVPRRAAAAGRRDRAAALSRARRARDRALPLRPRR